MNIRDLQYLVALAQHRHFGRAADASFVSQPTLSTQIKKLEDELGVSLVERAPRNVLLTEVGAEIARRARGILAEVEQIKSIAQRTRDPESGSLRLGIFPTLGPYLLPHIVPRVRERYPRLELLLREEKSDQIVQMLREGSLDAGILALPLHDDSLHTEFLFEESFVLAVPEKHALTQSRKLTMDDLADQSLLLLEDGHCMRDQALEVCHMAGATEKTGFRATSLETLRQMVAANVGITLLPALSVKPPVAAQTGQVRLLRFAEPAPTRRIAMVWRKSSAAGAFLHSVAEVVRGLPADLFDDHDIAV